MDLTTATVNNDELLCPTDFPVDSVDGATGEEFDVVVLDEDGCPADLTGIADDTGAGGGGSGGDPGDPGTGTGNGLKEGWGAWYIAKPAYWTNIDLVRMPGRAVDLAAGRFRFKIPAMPAPDRRVRPGVYLAEFTIKNPNGDVRLRSRRYWDVQPTVEVISHGPPTIADIRLALADFPCRNTLLEDYQFSKAEIMAALRRPVNLWNETPPLLQRYRFTVTDFPFTEHWMRATIGNLFMTAAAVQRRNDMTFQAATITARDNDKHGTYQSLGTAYTQEYEEWVIVTKKSLNYMQGFVTQSSPYRYKRRRVWGIGY